MLLPEQVEKKSEHSSKLDFKNCYLAAQTFMPDSKSRLKPASPNNQKDPTVIYGLFRPRARLLFCLSESPFLLAAFYFGWRNLNTKRITQGSNYRAPTFYDLVKVFGRNIPVIGNESSGRRKNLTTYTCSKQRLNFLIL